MKAAKPNLANNNTKKQIFKKRDVDESHPRQS